MATIIQAEHPALRASAKTVSDQEIGAKKIAGVIKKMSRALAECDDGVALAAPQIGQSLRLFIVAGKLFAKAGDPTIPQDLVFINPVIKKMSRKKKLLEEGCLSVRFRYGKTKRAEKVTLLAKNEHGEKITRNASGLLAQIFQHEIDHLNGVLFIDHATDLREIKNHPS